MSPSDLEAFEGPEGWFFLRPSAVPDRWRERAVPMMLVPMMPGEASRVLNGTRPQVPAGDEPLARLVADGLTARQIADELDMSLRSVYRRLSRLRALLGVESTAELTARLAKRGF